MSVGKATGPSTNYIRHIGKPYATEDTARFALDLWASTALSAVAIIRLRSTNPYRKPSPENCPPGTALPS